MKPCARPYTIALLLPLLLALLAAATVHAAPTHSQRRRLAQRGRVERGRPLDLNHPLRQQVRAEALLGHALALVRGADLATVPRHVRIAMSKKLKKPVRSLRTRKGQSALLALLHHELGDARYELVVGTHASALKQAAQKLDGPPERRERDLRDMRRYWGFSLLPANDKAFSQPRYLASVLRESGQTGSGFVHNSPSGALDRFTNAWSKIAPANTRPVAFTQTGSDANNLMLEVALYAAGGNSKHQIRAGSILTLDGTYVAGRGPMSAQSHIVGPGKNSDLSITSPHTSTFTPRGAELARVVAAEKSAIAQLRERVKALQHTSTPVGALLFEPILGAKGVYVFRPQFVQQLRAVCDELRIPIIADEILTGGGRTGKFFAYEHYSGFEPDFVTFGKGLQIAGVAEVRRGREAPSFRPPRTMVTNAASSVPLLKGAQVLERIRKDSLIANAAVVGRYMLSHLQKDNPEARGVGLLLYGNQTLRVDGAMGRLMPHLDITKRDVDALLAEAKRSRRR